MNLEMLAKDEGSGDGGCPGVLLDHEDGFLVVQGQSVGNNELPNVLPGEAGVKISPRIVAEAMRIYQAKGLV